MDGCPLDMQCLYTKGTFTVWISPVRRETTLTIENPLVLLLPCKYANIVVDLKNLTIKLIQSKRLSVDKYIQYLIKP